jgi:hypothetical protein
LKYGIVIFILIFSWAASGAIKEIRIPKVNLDEVGSYYSELAERVLQAGQNQDEQGAKLISTITMDQSRAILELEKGTLDLIWVGAEKKLANKFRAIEIPLDRGLMGYRSFLVRKENMAKLSSLTSLDQLADYVACQGSNWPDTSIIVAAGLKVLDTPSYVNLYEKLHQGRCDYFPRGLHEAQVELINMQTRYPDFAVVEKLLLHYPYTIYFYTNKQDVALARLLERGLNSMIDKGELIKFMQTQTETAPVFPLSKWANSSILELANPELIAGTDTDNPRYWFSSADFKH